MKHINKRVCFAIGTGRCGTQFLYKLLAKEPTIASHHERHPLSDTFERYCRWNQLPVDQAGFLATKQAGIETDLAHHKISFEASAYLSLSLAALYEYFDARFVFLIRSPHKVVNSYLQKDWYAHKHYHENLQKASGYQPGMAEPHHSFSRMVPRGEEAQDWSDMTRVGKLAWFWRTLNQQILEQLESLPSENYRIIRIEDFDYSKYLELADFIGYPPEVSEDLFLKLTASRPNRLFPRRQVRDWTGQERAEFEQQVATLSERWDYPYITSRIVGGERQDQPTQLATLLNRYRKFRKEIKVKKKLIRYLEKF